jgi:hypothetical protein
MSYDIFLQELDRADPASKRPRGFLSRLRIAPRHLTRHARVRQVVRASGGPHQREKFGYFFKLPDGGSVELYVSERPERAMLAFDSLTPETSHFIYELLRATRWTGFAVDKVLSTRPIAAADLPAGFNLPITVVSSPSQITAALESDFSAPEDQTDTTARGRQ